MFCQTDKYYEVVRTPSGTNTIWRMDWIYSGGGRDGRRWTWTRYNNPATRMPYAGPSKARNPNNTRSERACGQRRVIPTTAEHIRRQSFVADARRESMKQIARLVCAASHRLAARHPSNGPREYPSWHRQNALRIGPEKKLSSLHRNKPHRDISAYRVLCVTDRRQPIGGYKIFYFVRMSNISRTTINSLKQKRISL